MLVEMHFVLLAAGLLFAAPEDHVGPFEDEAIVAPEQDALAPAEETADADDESDESDSAEAESESAQPGAAGPDIHYTADLSDQELQRRWQEDLPSLGSISVGFADQGRLINAVRMPDDPSFICRRPDLAFGAKETVDALTTAFRAVQEKFPGSAPARLSHIGAEEGGYLRPHRSHQTGRDADIGFFYKSDAIPRPGVRRDRSMDLPRNWALLRALITLTDVQVILVDRSIQRVLRDYALAAGEDREWIDRIFRRDRTALVQHAHRHRDHFHVRFYAPRSQELGRRIQPLLALRPEQNLAVHKVRSGQTLGQLARVYDTTVKAIRKANHMRGTMLHLHQRLLIPLRKPCTLCPLPPPVSVPPRCLPPAFASASTN